MSRAAKLLEKMRSNPHDWQIADVTRLAEAYGVTCRRGTGSHVTLSHPSRQAILTVPAKRPIKVFYIVSLVMFIDAIIESET